MEERESQLQILAIFHYVVGGLAALFACLPIFHLMIGISLLTELPNLFRQEETLFPFLIIPVMFILIPAALILAGWAFSICIAIAGRFLQTRKHHTYCLVMGGVETVFFPFGTALGIFTLLLITKPEVKELFEG